MLACKNGQLDVVEELRSRHANVNKKNKNGHTALMLAIECGDLPVVKELCDYRGNLITDPVMMSDIERGISFADRNKKTAIAEYLNDVLDDREKRAMPNSKKSKRGGMRSMTRNTLKHSNNPRKRSRSRRRYLN